MRIVVFMNISLDGVIQAPGRPDEDIRGGFKHGGWSGPYADPAMGKAVGESMSRTGGILLGRRTYEDFYSVWPKRTDNPFTEVLNKMRKHVVSRTLEEAAERMAAELGAGDITSPPLYQVFEPSFERMREILGPDVVAAAEEIAAKRGPPRTVKN